MSTQQKDTATTAPLPPRLSAAMVREAMRVTNMLDAGFPVERTALLISPAGDWRLPLPPLDDASVGTPITWAMVRVLATEFVLTIPHLSHLFVGGEGGPIAVIGMSKDAEAAICIPHDLPALAENASRVRLAANVSAALRAWLPQRALTLTADHERILQEAFGTGSPWELTPEGEPQIEINTRAQ